MNNLDIYKFCQEVPREAQRTIQAGKLKGFTDINPMWRIYKLTEMFGMCGVGWYTEVLDKRIEKGGDDGKQVAIVDINLYIKVGGEWSKPIWGTGGSMLVNVFKGTQDTSDEAFKMAYTDALSVACKALGMGADVYWKDGRSKYNQEPSELTASERIELEERFKKANEELEERIRTAEKTDGRMTDSLYQLARSKGYSVAVVNKTMEKNTGKKNINDLTIEEFRSLYEGFKSCEAKR